MPATPDPAALRLALFVYAIILQIYLICFVIVLTSLLCNLTYNRLKFIIIYIFLIVVVIVVAWVPVDSGTSQGRPAHEP